jgi:hypothetical protein
LCAARRKIQPAGPASELHRSATGTKEKMAMSTQEQRPTSWVARLLAILLALGGCGWGLLLSPWLLRAHVTPLAVALFGPGYLVTLGYIVRSVSTPPAGVRMLIWASSLLVQGAWLLFLIWGVTEKVASGGSATTDASNLMMAWWAFATAASVAGLLADLPKKTETGATADGGPDAGG